MKFVKKKYENEVNKGWLIPFPLEITPRIKYTSIIPIGVAIQLNIN